MTDFLLRFSILSKHKQQPSGQRWLMENILCTFGMHWIQSTAMLQLFVVVLKQRSKSKVFCVPVSTLILLTIIQFNHHVKAGWLFLFGCRGRSSWSHESWTVLWKKWQVYFKHILILFLFKINYFIYKKTMCIALRDWW